MPASCAESARGRHSADRCFSDAGVNAFSVVVVQSGIKCVGSLVVVVENLPVGLFGGEAAVEAFDIADRPSLVVPLRANLAAIMPASIGSRHG